MNDILLGWLFLVGSIGFYFVVFNRVVFSGGSEMSWFYRDKEIPKEEVKKDEITFSQEPPATQPIIVNKCSIEFGKIWIDAGEHKFRPSPRIQFPYSGNQFYLDYSEEDLLLIYSKVKSLNSGLPL